MKEAETPTFKCGGLLGSMLQMSYLAGVDMKELKEKDEKWSKLLKPITPKSLED